MCGIIGYKGPRNANDVVLKGLKSLEYRGYDSWGIATKNAHKIHIVKHVGKIGSVSLSDLHLPESSISVGHTRWATHGNVSEANAHPHASMDNKIAVVHNGIVENFQKLKQMLLKKGYTFRSSTDTEIIPNYIQQEMSNGKSFVDAVTATVKAIDGYFAIVALHAESNTMIGARRGSPLVVGIGEKNDELFFASDVPAFLAYTKNVIYLDDDEIAISGNETRSAAVIVKNIHTTKEITKKIHHVTWNVEQAQKGDYPHFMLKEIHEQEFTLKSALEQDHGVLEKVTERITKARGVFFVGCGTSYHACVSAAYTFSHVAHMHVNVVLASEFMNYEEFLTEKTLMIAVSQSGETADLLDAVKTAKQKNVTIVSIVNVVGSSLARMSDQTMTMNAGPEICVLSTKSYTSQLAILLLLAYALAGKEEEGKTLIEHARKQVKQIIENNSPKIKKLASALKDKRDLFLIGRDLAYPSALEGALKIKEVSYIHAEGFAGGELKHGTIALIEDGIPVIVLTTDATRNLILSNTMEVKARGGYIIGINSQQNELYDFFLEVPEVGTANPLLMIIPIQLLAYYLALARHCDPDKPRNLAKSVTVK
ncbi:glutamine--fructose-6-phosphate transaminase (isomerizing) [Candidatus Woesearchaeota archaeon]|nr:glutamine--fructose-6-phosphate transaminase (isomerizing) [Candidatus Woesearchaeota archaeon]